MSKRMYGVLTIFLVAIAFMGCCAGDTTAHALQLLDLSQVNEKE